MMPAAVLPLKVQLVAVVVPELLKMPVALPLKVQPVFVVVPPLLKMAVELPPKSAIGGRHRAVVENAAALVGGVEVAAHGIAGGGVLLVSVTEAAAPLL